jgi:hypothetical protein
MKPSYAAFRSWIIAQIVDGATPRQVARALQTYRRRYLTKAESGWADGKPEIPSEEEADELQAKEFWS